MRRLAAGLPALAAVGLLLAGCAMTGGAGGESPSPSPTQASPTPSPTAPAEPAHVLAFSATGGYRHDSIPAGQEALNRLATNSGRFDVATTEDPAVFSDEGLAPYGVVVFLNTTGDILNDDQQRALERWTAEGGGLVGVHAATDTEHEWAWYHDAIGATFKTHPAVQPAELVVEDPAHPSTQGLAARFTTTDEWYAFSANPRGSVHVLLSLDEASYQPGDSAMGDHPIVWCKELPGGGRSWYSALGHPGEAYSTPEFETLLLGGILSVAGLEPSDCA